MQRVILKNKTPIALFMVIAMLLVSGIGNTMIEAEDENLLTQDVYIEDMMNYSTAIDSITEARNELATSLSDWSSRTAL